MNKPYSKSSYGAEWALTPKGTKTAITQNGVGMWWKASFKDGKYLVAGVMVKNRVDCCGERLTRTLVTVGGQECGKLPASTATGKWYNVKCAKPLVGGEIQLTTTTSNYL
jgi:hypothetical protein